MRAAPVPLFLAVLALAGCGGGGKALASKGTVGGTLPACAQAGAPAETPTALADLPLPQGSVLDKSRKDPLGNSVVEGFVPGDLGAVRDYFHEQLPVRGYDLGEGDAEDHEAETEFEGKGLAGKLKLHDIAGCDGVVTLAIAIKKGNQ